MLEQINLSLSVDHDSYEKELPKIQLRLLMQQQALRKAERPVVIMYEGWDASGKGGSIMRITEKLDPRGCHVWPVAAPTEVERAHHFLWRFWLKLPVYGEIAIFDRSWYGRVLVERVEKFAKKPVWTRAYQEICDFERLLVDEGTVLIKFWMHISKHEQEKRFKEREHNPYKSWKITPEDWRNREKWDEYVEAAEEMFARTDCNAAPWHLIAAEDKHYARLETARIVAERIEQALQG
ncbi:MAG TPA: UDP-galactose-lipid carrier transferase [Armatimonadota bacterium]|jgi:polyphosphate kinase 2 (PPK2 family)